MNNKLLPEEFCTAPAVFAVENTYQIMVIVKCEMLFWVTVDGTDYYDHSNGIIRSDTRVHRVSVPMEALDSAKKYTVCFRKIIERKPYFTESCEENSISYSFYPVRNEGDIKIYHLSDTHGDYAFSSLTGKYFKDNIDILILNGDILDHSGEIENFELTFKLCEAVTGGEHPCVFSRGNHDLRGFYAERLEEYTPNCNGKSYYTFRLGKIWGIVLDCGEDKPDTHGEYGHTVSCRQFRREETEFLKRVADGGEFLDETVKYRFVIVHNPFTYTIEPPFDIEQELFKEWAGILDKKIKPHAIISGHLHETCVSEIGGKYDSKGQPCPVIVGSRAEKNEKGEVSDFIGCALTLKENKIKAEFTNSEHVIIKSETIYFDSSLPRRRLTNPKPVFIG